MSRTCAVCRVPFTPRRAHHRYCADCAAERFGWTESRGRVVALPDPCVLDVDVLRAAVRLTHPDLHPLERRAKATTVTATLNSAIDLMTGRRTR